jgi:hypothetical protein
MNKDHIESLIAQIEFGHERGHKCEHSEKELKRLQSMLSGDTESFADLVNKCKSKNELESLVLEHKGIDIDKRSKLKDLKIEVLAL